MRPSLLRVLGVVVVASVTSATESKQQQAVSTSGPCDKNEQKCGSGCIPEADTCCSTNSRHCSADTYCVEDSDLCCPMGEVCGSLSGAGTVTSSFSYFSPSTALPTSASSTPHGKPSNTDDRTTTTTLPPSTSASNTATSEPEEISPTTTLEQAAYHYKADGVMAAAGVAIVAAVLF